MPHRKKSNLSYVSRSARKSRKLRLKERPLDAQQERDCLSKIQFEPWEASEDGRQGDGRFSSGQEIRKEVRSEVQREARLAKDRERHAYMRMWESGTQREKRLAESRERTAQMRKNESEFQRAIRLARDRERHARMRARDRQRHAFMTETMADYIREAYMVCSNRPPPEIVEYKLEQPTVLEKIEITKNILDKSKVAQSPSLAGTTTPLNTTCRYSGSGRPLEKRPRQEAAAAEDDLNDDKMFMLSVAGKMKHLSPADNLKFRLEVQQLLLDKLCPDVENNASTSGTSQNASFAAVMIKEEVEEETLTDENLVETQPIEIKKEVEENTVDSSTNELNMDYN